MAIVAVDSGLKNPKSQDYLISSDYGIIWHSLQAPYPVPSELSCNLNTNLGEKRIPSVTVHCCLINGA